jgi:hypothetical protein
MIVLWRATGRSKEISISAISSTCTISPGKPRRLPEGLPSRVHVLAAWHGVDPPGTDAMPIPSATDAVAEPTPFAGGAIPSAGTGVRVTLTEYEGQRVRVRPDLLKLETFILEYLTDAQKRHRPEATIVNAELASNQLFLNLDVDNVPRLHRFKEKGCQLIEGTKP